MIATEKDGGVEFNIRVLPRASKSGIVGEHEGALKVRIASPPVDGAANQELVKVLAKSLGVSKSDISILSGHTSRYKRVLIANLSRSSFEKAIK